MNWTNVHWMIVSLHLLERWTVPSLNCGDVSRHNERWTGCSGPSAFLIKRTANPKPDSTDMWNTQHCVFFKGQPLSFPSSLLQTAMSAMPKWLEQNNRFLAVEKTKNKQARDSQTKAFICTIKQSKETTGAMLCSGCMQGDKSHCLNHI